VCTMMMMIMIIIIVIIIIIIIIIIRFVKRQNETYLRLMHEM